MSLDILKDLPTLIETVGMYGVWLILFLESCVVFFLPGDSLLFVAGFFASQGLMPISLLIIGGIIAAVMGNKVGYVLGARYGSTLFVNEKGRLFNPKNLARTEAFYAKHGKMALIISRFMPVVRTFTPVFAGICGMDKKTFFIYNLIGAALWVGGLAILGFFLGKLIPANLMEKYLLAIIGVIIVLSFVPALVHIWQEKKNAKK